MKKININPKIKLSTSLSWRLQESTFIPVAILTPLIIFVCMSLSTLDFTTLSYVTFGALMLGFIFLAFIYLRNREISTYGGLSLLTMTVLLLISLINFEDSDFKNGIYMAIEIWMFQILCYFYRERIHVIIIIATILLSFCVYVNFVHLLLHPNLWIIEEDKNNMGYLLGDNYNGMGFRFILALTFSFLCTRYSWKWIINAILVAIFSIAPLVMTGSKTSLTGITFFLVICILPFVKLQKNLINIGLVFFILFQTFVVFVGKGLENNETAVYLIEDVLEKDITFTGRTYLWDMSLNEILNSPIWGVGFLDTTWYLSHIHTQYGTGPCNFILSVLLNGGIILLLLIAYIFITSYKKVIIYNERYAVIIQAGLASILLIHLMEMGSYVFIFYLMTLAYYYPYIRSEQLTKNDSNK